MAEALATIQGYEVTLQMEASTRTQKDGEATPCTLLLLFRTESNLINVSKCQALCSLSSYR